jgi:hypothetical protein
MDMVFLQRNNIYGEFITLIKKYANVNLKETEERRDNHG